VTFGVFVGDGTAVALPGVGVRVGVCGFGVFVAFAGIGVLVSGSGVSVGASVGVIDGVRSGVAVCTATPGVIDTTGV
jgi:hypothetical protein